MRVQVPPYRARVDVGPGGDLSGGQAGITAAQSSDGASRVDAAPGLNRRLGAWYTVLLVLVTLVVTDRLTDLWHLSLIAHYVLVAVVALGLALLTRAVLWGLRERAIRRAADAAVASREDADSTQGE